MIYWSLLSDRLMAPLNNIVHQSLGHGQRLEDETLVDFWPKPVREGGYLSQTLLTLWNIIGDANQNRIELHQVVHF
jgi:hypothetical protein